MGEQIFLFSSCTLFNGKLFFVEIQNGLPAMMDLNNGEVTYCDALNGFDYIAGGDMVDFIQSYGNKVYILENAGINLIIFDLVKKQCQYIELKCNCNSWGNYSAFERYGPYLYIFPKYENKIIVLDTNNNEITEKQNCFDEKRRIQCTCRVDNQVWILLQDISMIYAYDLATEKLKSYKLEKILEDCIDAIHIDGNIYILNQFGIVYVWDIDNEKLQEITMLEVEHTEDKSMCRIIYAGDKLIFFPAWSADIKILDLLTAEIKVYHDYPVDFKYHEIKWSKFHRSCEDKDYYYFAMRLGNYFLKICKSDGKLLWIKPKLPSDEKRIKSQDLFVEQKLRLYVKEKNTIHEEEYIGITRIINTCLEENCVEKESCMGEVIYKKMK